jgi:hypothetical protein
MLSIFPGSERGLKVPGWPEYDFKDRIKIYTVPFSLWQ